MRLSEIKGEAALDLLADIIEPATEIMTDPNVKKLMGSSKNKGAIAKVLIKNHKKAIIEILALVEGVPVDKYECNVFSLPMKVIELLNDKDLIDFFSSQELIAGMNSFSAPVGNTTEVKE